MKKLILFGAGQIGKAALEFWGEDSIECFVDNNPTKVGTLLEGKKIISFQDLLQIYQNYQIMITANCYGEIAEQLKQAGILEYKKYMIPNIKKLLAYLESIDLSQFSQIALYGSDEYTISIIKNLPNTMKEKICCVLDDKKFSSQCCGYTVYQTNEIEQKFDAVLITSPLYHIAHENHLEKVLKPNIRVLNPYKMRSYYSPNELIINKYEIESNECHTEEEINEKNRNRTDYFEAVNAYLAEVKDKAPLFKLVEIETINRCNGSCSFCPVNCKNDPREKHIMSEDLFYSIIKQLEDMKYTGRLSLFSNNEPFLDERIIVFSRFAREHLPYARIHMFTNGTLLTLEKFKEIIPYLDELIIDNYTQDLHLIKPVQEIKDYCENNPHLIQKVSVVLRKPNEILTSRGGAAPNRTEKESYPLIPCAFPFQQLIIRPTGEISLCCNDALGQYTMGDLTKESILDVWYGKKYIDIRKKIAEGRKNIKICQECDTFSLYL